MHHRHQGIAYSRPCGVFRRGDRWQHRAESRHGIEADHGLLECKPDAERRICQEHHHDGACGPREGLSKRPVERRALGDGTMTQSARSLFRVAERIHSLAHGLAGGERFIEVGRELARNVRAFAASQARAPGDGVHQRAQFVGKRGGRRARAALSIGAGGRRCMVDVRFAAHAITPGSAKVNPSAPIAAVSRRHVRVSSASRFFPSGVSR